MTPEHLLRHPSSPPVYIPPYPFSSQIPNSLLLFLRFSSSSFAMAAQTVVLKVGMSCQGCVGAVTRVLTKMEGVESFDVDIKEQKVTVKGNVQPDAVFQTVSKTGKKTEFWPTDAPAAVEPKAADVETPAPAEAVAV